MVETGRAVKCEAVSLFNSVCELESGHSGDHRDTHKPTPGDYETRISYWQDRNPKLYVIGSLRNARVPVIAERLRAEGFDVFDDWYAAGPEADDYWQRYETGREHTYAQALDGYSARHVFEYDRAHLDAADIVVLVMKAGTSAAIEFGRALGQGKRGYILYEGEPERWDVMVKFADGVAFDVGDLCKMLPKSLAYLDNA